ncbi:fascin domain-containing protein [Azospirillum rugosum]|uniref:Glycosyl transferase family 8 n=1 Tax=Azospirillum rugosum TaxID=416170 RepID=A0ABS4SS99_9PROT|nr:hypothetical protein [Azospirillum rugosum]MBP2294265.1 hypothetical protein [Azospirillum rugosum]MDQ0527600.1 hypothetical protein [Azospirillum rugosum]
MNNNKYHVLLTFFGTFVCYDEKHQKFIHRKLINTHDRNDISQFYVGASTLSSVEGAPIAFDIVNPEGGRAVHLRLNGLFLCADPDGNVHASRTEANPWETFLILSWDELDNICFITANDWISRSDGRIIEKSEIKFSSEFCLSFGPYKILMKDNLPIPFRKTSESFQGLGTPPSYDPAVFNGFSFWLNNWQAEEFSLYRPLIYYCAFGEKSFNLLKSSLKSLHFLADYRGDVLVIGDKDKDFVDRHAPEEMRPRIHVWNLPACDFIDFCAARYMIPLWRKVAGFQPFLYVDTDVLFDLGVQDLMQTLALSAKMTAQREDFSFLATAPSVGATLLQEAGCKPPDDERGFNSGIIGIPSISDHARTLLKIRDTIYRYAQAKSNRRALSHFDQAIANYVAFKTSSFDLDLLSDKVRWVDADVLCGGKQRLGFVHFWGASDKAKEMSRYVDHLSNDSPEPTPSVDAIDASRAS